LHVVRGCLTLGLYAPEGGTKMESLRFYKLLQEHVKCG